MSSLQLETQNNLESWMCTSVQTELVLVHWREETSCCCSNKPLYSLTKCFSHLVLHVIGGLARGFALYPQSGMLACWNLYFLLVLPFETFCLCSLSIRLSQRLKNCPGKWKVTHITSKHITLARTSHVALSNGRRAWDGGRGLRWDSGNAEEQTIPAINNTRTKLECGILGRKVIYVGMFTYLFAYS